MKRYLWLLLAFAPAFFSGCKKEYDEKKAPKDALINNLWRWDQLFIDGEKQNLDSCQSDDTWQFLANNTLIWKNNANRCITNYDSIKAWEWRLNGSSLTVIYGTDSTSYSIKSLDNTLMVLEQAPPPYEYRYIFSAK